MLHQSVVANFNAPMESPMYNTVDVVDLRYHLVNGNAEISVPEDASRYPQIMFPRMRTPFGIQDQMNATATSAKNLELEIAEEEFAQFLQAFEARNVNFFTINSRQYLGREMSVNDVRSMMNPIILPTKPTDYYSRCRLKVDGDTWIWLQQVDGSFIRGGICDVRARRDLQVTVAPKVYKIHGRGGQKSKCGVTLRCLEIRVLQ